MKDHAKSVLMGLSFKRGKHGGMRHNHKGAKKRITSMHHKPRKGRTDHMWDKMSRRK